MEEELYNRYNLLKNNIKFYLLQFMYEDSDKEFKEKNDKRFYLGYTCRKNKEIYLKIDNYNLEKIINFMFKPVPNYGLLKSFDYKKTQIGLDLIDKKRRELNDPNYQEKLDLEYLFILINNYLDNVYYNNTQDIYSLDNYMDIYKKENLEKQKTLKK